MLCFKINPARKEDARWLTPWGSHPWLTLSRGNGAKCVLASPEDAVERGILELPWEQIKGVRVEIEMYDPDDVRAKAIQQTKLMDLGELLKRILEKIQGGKSDKKKASEEGYEEESGPASSWWRKRASFPIPETIEDGIFRNFEIHLVDTKKAEVQEVKGSTLQGLYDHPRFIENGIRQAEPLDTLEPFSQLRGIGQAKLYMNERLHEVLVKYLCTNQSREATRLLKSENGVLNF